MKKIAIHSWLVSLSILPLLTAGAHAGTPGYKGYPRAAIPQSTPGN